MVGLHVQLDVEYALDEKLVGVGPYAELLYVRALCFAKRTMLDGKITWNQLAAIAHGIPNHRKHADLLLSTGAFAAMADGVYITGWLKRNKPAARIRAEAQRKSREALERNHDRWHVKEGKPNASCVLCYPDDDQNTDHRTDQNTDPSTEWLTEDTETEVETETQPEAEAESSILRPPSRAARESLESALDAELGPARTDSERSNRNKTIRELTDVGADDLEIHRRSSNYHDRWPDARLTDNALRKHWSALARERAEPEPEPPPAPAHDPDCPDCDGTGIVYVEPEPGDRRNTYARRCGEPATYPPLRAVGEPA